MQTLTYGRKKPDDGDKGGGASGFFDALEGNIDLDDAHDHDGTNSARLTSSASTIVTQAILAASWAVSGSGFRQLVTCPGVIQYDTHAVSLRNTANGRNILATTERVTATTFYVYVNDNTLNLTVIYN